MIKYITLFLFTVNCFAQDVHTIKKGELAPYDGVLFTHKKEQEIRLINEEYKMLKDVNKLYEEKINIHDKRLELRDKQIDDMAKRLAENKESSIWSKIGFFILGSVITTGVVYGVSKATNR